MKLRRSIYSRPEIVRGQHCIRDALLDPAGRKEQQVVAGLWLWAGGLPHRGSSIGSVMRSSLFVRRDEVGPMGSYDRGRPGQVGVGGVTGFEPVPASVAVSVSAYPSAAWTRRRTSASPPSRHLA
jgi:hypothetical protein